MGLSDVISRVTDPYERQARLWPALLALLPTILTVYLLYGTRLSLLTNVAALVAACGGLYLLANLCRERGKALEPILYARWGGKPSTQLLRHRDNTLERVTKQRYHAFLSGKIKMPFPDASQEATAPREADEIYQSGVRWLLNQTRDTKKFGLLFKENITYGFRRNALGLKSVAVAVAMGTAFGILLVQGVVSFTSTPFHLEALISMATEVAFALAGSVVMLSIWLFGFTESGVRAAAFTYAETLLRACDALDG